MYLVYCAGTQVAISRLSSSDASNFSLKIDPYSLLNPIISKGFSKSLAAYLPQLPLAPKTKYSLWHIPTNIAEIKFPLVRSFHSIRVGSFRRKAGSWSLPAKVFSTTTKCSSPTFRTHSCSFFNSSSTNKQPPRRIRISYPLLKTNLGNPVSWLIKISFCIHFHLFSYSDCGSQYVSKYFSATSLFPHSEREIVFEYIEYPSKEYLSRSD